MVCRAGSRQRPQSLAVWVDVPYDVASAVYAISLPSKSCFLILSLAFFLLYLAYDHQRARLLGCKSSAALSPTICRLIRLDHHGCYSIRTYTPTCAVHYWFLSTCYYWIHHPSLSTPGWSILSGHHLRRLRYLPCIGHCALVARQQRVRSDETGDRQRYADLHW